MIIYSDFVLLVLFRWIFNFYKNILQASGRSRKKFISFRSRQIRVGMGQSPEQPEAARRWLVNIYFIKSMDFY